MCPQLLYTQSSSLFPPLPLLPLFLPLSLHRVVRHQPLLSSGSPCTSYFSSPPPFLPRPPHPPRSPPTQSDIPVSSPAHHSSLETPISLPPSTSLHLPSGTSSSLPLPHQTD